MAAQPVPPAWDAPLQQLLARRVLDGYGLLDHNTGKCIASFGSLTAELWGSCSSGSSAGGSDQEQQQGPLPAAAREEEPSPAARQIHVLFSSAAQPDHIDICGQQAVIVQRGDSSIYAVSRSKQLGLTAHYLPGGVLVTVFSKPNLLQTVVPQVEAACDPLRQA